MDVARPDVSSCGCRIGEHGWLGIGWSGTRARRRPQRLAALVALEDVLVETIAKCEKSVVSIARIRRRPVADNSPNFGAPDFFRGGRASNDPPENPTNPDFIPNEFGTGVVIDAKGLILTNYHVVVRSDDSDGEAERGFESELWVTTIDRRPYRAKIVGADPRSDLAVLSIEAEGLTPISMGDAALLRKGQIVISLGNPYAIARDGQVSAAWGIVANLARKAGPVPAEDIRDGRTTLHHFGTLIQTDAKLNLGTSGGPLLNLKGEMVGLTTSQAALAGYEQAAGYAIPVDGPFKRIIDDLKNGREVEYGFLGIGPTNLSSEERLNGANGMRVGAVLAGMPAMRAGLKTDDVVLAVDGERVYDVDGLMLYVGRQAVESVTRLTIMRDGHTMSVDVELGKFPVRGEQIVTSPRPAWRGLKVDYASMLTNEMQFRGGFGFPGEPVDMSGVAVMDVVRDSAAWKAGLRPNTIVSHVGGTTVHNPREFLAAVEDKAGDVELRVSSLATDFSARRLTVQDEQEGN
ncbi:MAG: trypsin-like peptidase domain-containing protein, partial [Pirellulales bacterium]